MSKKKNQSILIFLRLLLVQCCRLNQNVSVQASSLNRREPAKGHENILPSLDPSHRSTELTTKSRERKFPCPLWVRGIFVPIL